MVSRCRDEGEREKFSKRISGILETGKVTPGHKVVVILRADFEPRLDTSIEAISREAWYGYRYIIPPFTQDELRDIILKPAEQEVLFFNPPELVDDLINEVIQQPVALPLLSFTLHELYEKSNEHEGSRELTQEAYIKVGGVIGSLTKQIEIN